MVQVKVSELSGAALDYAVAVCEEEWVVDGPFDEYPGYPAFSIDWSQGGPIIERENIGLVWRDQGQWSYWYAHNGPLLEGKGQTPLIAAMRCYVSSKMGDVVEIPDELIEG